MSGALDMTGIDKLPSGKYRVRVQRGHQPVKVPLCETPEEAVVLRRAILKEIGAGEVVPVGGLSLVQWGPTWLQRFRSSKRGFSAERQRFWTHLATAEFARRPLAAISRRDVKEWLATLKKATTKHKWGKRPATPLSLQTRRHCLNLLRILLHDAVEEELLRVNPALGLKISEDAPPVTEELFLDLESQRRALDACGDDPERWIVQFAIGTGLRQGEQWNLHLSDVHHDGDDPHIMVRFGSEGRTPKNGKVRKIPLFGVGLEAAREWLKLLPAYAPHNPKALMFPTPSHKRWNGKGFVGGARRQKCKAPIVWKKVREAFAPRRVWWHLLRHTTASSLVAGWWGEKWRLEEVRGLMGHSTIRVTERYAHLADSTLRQVAAATQKHWDAGASPQALSRGCHDPQKPAETEGNLAPSKPKVVRSNRSGRTEFSGKSAGI
jgi:integrase